MKVKVPFTVHRSGNSSDSLHTLHAYKQVQFKNAPTSPTGTRTVFMYKTEHEWNPIQDAAVKIEQKEAA
jgi:hypothetical protein